MEGFELGYIYAHNKIDEFSGVICDNDCWVDEEGHTQFIPFMYQFTNVMDMENFNIYLETYYSLLNCDNRIATITKSDARYGARLRFQILLLMGILEISSLAKKLDIS